MWTSCWLWNRMTWTNALLHPSLLRLYLTSSLLPFSMSADFLHFTITTSLSCAGLLCFQWTLQSTCCLGEPSDSAVWEHLICAAWMGGLKGLERRWFSPWLLKLKWVCCGGEVLMMEPDKELFLCLPPIVLLPYKSSTPTPYTWYGGPFVTLVYVWDVKCCHEGMLHAPLLSPPTPRVWVLLREETQFIGVGGGVNIWVEEFRNRPEVLSELIWAALRKYTSHHVPERQKDK